MLNEYDEEIMNLLKIKQEIEELKTNITNTKEYFRKEEEKLKKKVENIDILIENSYFILTKLGEQFEKETELSKEDKKEVLFFTSIQITRQFILECIFKNNLFSLKNENYRIAHDDSDMKKRLKIEKENSSFYKISKDSNITSNKYRTVKDILLSPSIPYDAARNSKKFNENLGGGHYHRAKTLGHDPILGWIFGVFNILTGTITLSNLNTYQVDMNGLTFEKQVSTFGIFDDGIRSIIEDPRRLVAAVFMQSLHLKSDINTKAGLPIPILTLFENFGTKIYKSYDWICLKRDLSIIGIQYIFAKIIDFILICYREIKYQNIKIDRNIHQAKTQKIILFSNSLSSTNNIVKVLLTKKYYSLDIGGILNTLINFFVILNKLSNLKLEYMFDNFEKLVKGEIEEWQIKI